MQLTKESTSEMNREEFRVTMKIKQPLITMPRLDFFAIKHLQGQKYSMQNGLYSNLMFDRQKHLTNVLIALLIIDTVLLYLFYETQQTQMFGLIWLPLSFTINVFSTLMFVLLLLVKLEQNRQTRRQNESISKMTIKIIIFLITHPMPWLANVHIALSYDDLSFENKETYLELNHILIIFTIVKNLFLSYFKFLVNTCYLNPRGKRLKRMFSVEMSQQMYAIKCIFNESPIKMFISIYLIGYFSFSFSFKIVQSSVPIENNPFRYFENCLWFTFATATTVGYGDMRLFTHLGYIMDICCMVWGTLATSCILFILINTLTLNSREEESLSSLKHVQNELQLRTLSRLFIRKCLWRVWSNHKQKRQMKESVDQRKMRIRLSQLRKEQKFNNSSNNITQISQKQFNNVTKMADSLRSNNIQLINFISNHIFSQSLLYQKQEKPFSSTIQQEMASELQNKSVQQVKSVSFQYSQNNIRQESRVSAARSHKFSSVKIEDMEEGQPITIPVDKAAMCTQR